MLAQLPLAPRAIMLASSQTVWQPSMVFRIPPRPVPPPPSRSSRGSKTLPWAAASGPTALAGRPNALTVLRLRRPPLESSMPANSLVPARTLGLRVLPKSPKTPETLSLLNGLLVVDPALLLCKVFHFCSWLSTLYALLFSRIGLNATTFITRGEAGRWIMSKCYESGGIGK